MKKPAKATPPSSDVAGISGTIERALAAAGLSGSPGALRAGTPTVGKTRSNASPGSGNATTSFSKVLDKGMFATKLPRASLLSSMPRGGTAPAEQTYPGQFTSRTYKGPAGALDYKLYVPVSYAARASESFPLIVMLHGCRQSSDDFAAGTRMNELAEKHGFLVAYPAQTVSANGSKCWNWFRAEDQRRDTGEPSLIAGITREVAAHYRIDQRRIFVAGLSAGAAMAVVLGATYPELYAGVGAHSGLAHRAAHDVPSALAAMRNGSAESTGTKAQRVRSPQASDARSVPTIVFHGDGDKTVDVKNGIRIVEQATISGKERGLRMAVEQGVAAGGGRFTRTIYAEGKRPIVEYWLLHGAGHAWSGGSSQGSYTDAHGPDASSAMVRFFYSQV